MTTIKDIDTDACETAQKPSLIILTDVSVFDDQDEPADDTTTPHLMKMHQGWRKKTSCLINAIQDPDDETVGTPGGQVMWTHMRSPADLEDAGEGKKPRRLSGIDRTKSAGTQNAQVQSVMLEVEMLVDSTYDILAADMLLSGLKNTSTQEQWEEVMKSPVFERFVRKLGYFDIVGKAVLLDISEWINIYTDSTGTRTINVRLDPKDPYSIEYRVRAQINAKLTHCLAVANEIQLLPEWNGLVVGKPETVGPRTAHYIVLNYQMSAVGGLYKIDVFNEIRRFSDVEGGFMAEYIQAVSEDHVSYRPPPAGFKRPKANVRNMWVACGDEHSIFIQLGKAQAPFSISSWVAKTIGAVAGRLIIGGLVNNSMRASEPGSHWEQPLREDKLGFYASIDACVQSPASLARRPMAGTAGVKDFDLTPFFEKRHMGRFLS